MHAGLSRTFLLALPLIVALALVSPVFAAAPADGIVAESAVRGQESGNQGGAGGAEGQALAPTVIWTLAGIIAGCVVLTALYMLKKRVGGFPENPDWVAPITIMYSKDFAGAEGDEASHRVHHGDPHAPEHH